MISVMHGDCRDVLRELDADSIEACFTDPPYEINFMSRAWDREGAAFEQATWTEAYRVLKPGAYLMACGGTRTYHRLVCAIEDAGFEVRDCCSWLYGSGFPKSRDASKAIDQELGAERKGRFEGSFDRRAGPTGNKRCDRCGQWLISSNPCTCPRVGEEPVTPQAAQWDGFGTALKPAQELIVLARKPMTGNLAQNLLKHGTGAINVDGCRVSYVSEADREKAHMNALGPVERYKTTKKIMEGGRDNGGFTDTHDARGRWPANLCHDGSEEVEAAFAAFGERSSGGVVNGHEPSRTGDNGIYGHWGRVANKPHQDTGTASRFFFSPKADAEARIYECTICQRKINAADRARHRARTGEVLQAPEIAKILAMSPARVAMHLEALAAENKPQPSAARPRRATGKLL